MVGLGVYRDWPITLTDSDLRDYGIPVRLIFRTPLSKRYWMNPFGFTFLQASYLASPSPALPACVFG
jgi:hypothetical protein